MWETPSAKVDLLAIERVLLFLSANYKRPKKASSGFSPEWRTSIRDVQAIEEHATFLSNKLQFMMDATLGLVSIGRLVLFLANESEGMKWPKDMRAQLKVMQRDVQSLSDHATYQLNKITFLLDAVLGMVSIEQNNIIKIFSVEAVGLMPPTLIASIYGMNFKKMPELEWTYGYPFAIALMLIAAVLPYLYFKWRRWL